MSITNWRYGCAHTLSWIGATVCLSTVLAASARGQEDAPGPPFGLRSVVQPAPEKQPERIDIPLPRAEAAPAAPTVPPAGPTMSLLDEAFGTDVEGSFLPDVQGTRIYAGKKADNIDLGEFPPIANNNYRQAIIKTPGLILSEETTPLVSLGYRGLDPHRTQFTQVLKDGIPIHADQFGYPEAYYTPPLQVIDRLDFIRGGAALMYGPQPGGALNFVTKSPVTDRRFAFESEQLFGTNSFFSTYNAVSGTDGPVGYYIYQHHRQSDGYRQFNSEFDLDYGGAKFVFESSETSRWTLGFDLYAEAHGEPGGLSRAVFEADPSQTTRFNDQFELERYSGSLMYQEAITDSTFFEARLWAVYYSRFSRRQRGGGFGVSPSGAASALADFELQEFRTIGFEPRIRQDWGDDEVFTIGTMYYHTDSPRRDTRDSVLLPDSLGSATPGQPRVFTDREVDYFPIFAENLFRFGRWSITPGVRLENIWQDLRELQNETKRVAGAPLAIESEADFEPLFGLGIAYDIWDKNILRGDELRAYFNISQAYRPKIFTQAISTAVGQTVAGDLAPGESYQADVGLRGRPIDWITFDTSLFYLELNDQIGTVTTGPGMSEIRNVGDAVHQGAELFVEADLWRWDEVRAGRYRNDGYGAVTLFHSAMWLDAEFVAGPNTGRTPQYAPDYSGRGGIAYTTAMARLMLGGTWIDSHFAADNNPADRFVPAYTVWDLTGQIYITPRLSVTGGINNLFNEKYFARIRNDGIDPAADRNYYLGARLDY
jgi:Fe(3+) dicitrate transport protein